MTGRAAELEVDVLLFGPLADAAAAAKVRFSLPPDTCVGDLVRQVGERFPAIRGRLASTAVAVNREYVARSAALRDGDEVALIPPVSGG
jgi:molybdopterin converting factor subunit 1